jgi:hypothetical protein
MSKHIDYFVKKENESVDDFIANIYLVIEKTMKDNDFTDFNLNLIPTEEKTDIKAYVEYLNKPL